MRLRGAKGEDGLASCGWTRVTYLLFALTILIALAQVRGPSADPRPLASKIPGGATTEENQPVAEGDGHEPAARTAHHEDQAGHTTLADGDEEDQSSAATADGDAGAGNSGPPIFYRPAPVNAAPDSPSSGVDEVPCV